MRLQLQNIHKSYPLEGKQKKHALTDITFSLQRGEYLCILGNSGAGKTALFHVLACITSADAGRYILDGQDLGALSCQERDAFRIQNIGMVLEGENLLPELNALDNVALPLRYTGIGLQQRRELARKALIRVGASAEILTAHPDVLSDVEKKQVALGRAVIHRPKLLLLDAPTQGFNSAACYTFLSILSQLHKEGASIILMTQDLFVAEAGDRILSLKDGQISAEATRRETIT